MAARGQPDRLVVGVFGLVMPQLQQPKGRAQREWTNA